MIIFKLKRYYTNIKMKKFIKIIYLVIITFPLLFLNLAKASEKLKIGILAPMTGPNKNLGQSIIKSIRLAVKDIDSNLIEVIPKDTSSSPEKTLQSANELKEMGVRIVIGPIFYENLIYLDEIDDLTFLSLTNKTLDLPKNVISAGVNSTSQLNTIKRFLKETNINRTIFLTPIQDYEFEIKKGIRNSKIKIFKNYDYSIEPTKLTKQIEEITNYRIRKQNLEDEITRIKNSDDSNKENKIKKLKQRYTLGGLNFDAVIIADFDKSLKSVTTSLLYTDVSPKKKYFITLNQWFDQSLLNEITIQPIYYPSINKDNFENYKKKFLREFNEYPSHLSLLSYDLVGLIYYLSSKNDFLITSKLFKVKNSFKGMMGIFDIKNNKINHRLNFYKIEDKKLTKIF
ncbi:ABC transporter substrate-binding protein [Candidatus Pelagibacter sp.]|nr:ABC transporter substrate-binding protein [Candidatus Pelagibacter sp.]